MNNDLISRDYLKSLAYTIADEYCGEKQVVDLSDINNAPTVDTDEIYKKGYHNGFFATHGEPERPQGKWVIQRLQNSFDDVYCPFCNARPTRSEYGYYLKDNFCHECGADMRGSVK